MSAMTSDLLVKKIAWDRGEVTTLVREIEERVAMLSGLPKPLTPALENDPFRALAAPIVDLKPRPNRVTAEQMFYDYD